MDQLGEGSPEAQEDTVLHSVLGSGKRKSAALV